jgi:hypothetical protein
MGKLGILAACVALTGCATQYNAAAQLEQAGSRVQQSRDDQCRAAFVLASQFNRDMRAAADGCLRDIRPESEPCLQVRVLSAVSRAAPFSAIFKGCLKEPNHGGLPDADILILDAEMSVTTHSLRELTQRATAMLAERRPRAGL